MRNRLWTLSVLSALCAPLWACSAIIDTEDYVFCDEDDELCEDGAVLQPVENCEDFNNALEGEWSSGCLFEDDIPQELVYSFEVDSDCDGELTVDRIFFLPNDAQVCDLPVWVDQKRFDYIVDEDSLDEGAVRLDLTAEDHRFAVINETGVEVANMDPPFLGFDDWKLDEWRILLDMVVPAEDGSEYDILHRGDTGYLGVVPHVDGSYRFSPPTDERQAASKTYEYGFHQVSGQSAEEQFF